MEEKISASPVDYRSWLAFVLERQLETVVKSANDIKGKLSLAGHGMGGSVLPRKLGEIARDGLDKAIDLALGQLNTVARKATVDRAILRSISEECLRSFLAQVKTKLSPGNQGQQASRDILMKNLSELDARLDRALHWFDAGLLTVTEPQVPISMTNAIHVGSMIGSTIQQGSPNSNQNAQISIGDVGASLAEIERLIEQATIEDADRRTLAADIATIRAQLEKPAPSRSIIAEAGASIRSIVENLVASAILSPQATQAAIAFGRAIGMG